MLALVVAGLVVAAPGGPPAANAADASCDCVEVGPFVEPAEPAEPYISDAGLSKASGPRYQLTASGSLPSIHLEIRRTSDDGEVFDLTTAHTNWGFSPDQERFLTWRVNGPVVETTLYSLTAGNPETPVWSSAVATSSSAVGFSPHGEFVVHAYSTGALSASTTVYQAATGDSVWASAYTFTATAKKYGVAAWGFSPDDDEFLLAHTTGATTVQMSLVNLASGVGVHSTSISGSAYWRFSPCGSALGVVTNRGGGQMSVSLIGSGTGSPLGSGTYPTADFSFDATSTHYRVIVDGIPHELAENVPATPDTCAPTWPDGAAITPSEIGPTSATLDWTDAVDRHGVTGYRVRREGTLVGSPTSSHYAATGLSAGHTYTFTVTALDAAGNASSALSREVTTTAGGPTWPDGATLTAAARTSSTVSLGWTAATDDVAVTGYRVYVDDVARLNVGTATTATVTGLVAGTSYVFAVQAVDGDGNESTTGPTVRVATYTLEQTDTDTITGQVWIDSDRDGVREGTDILTSSEFADYLVMAYQLGEDDEIIGSSTSLVETNGSYSLQNIGPGRWAVTMIAWRWSYGRAQTLPDRQQPYLLTVLDGHGWAGADIGLGTADADLPLPGEGTAGSVTGTVWEDGDGDGVRDSGEQGVPDVDVYCYYANSGGGGTCSATTDAQGHYSIQSLPLGVFSVGADAPDGWRGDTPQFLRVVGGSNTAADFAIHRLPDTSVAGTVYEDLDGDGRRDSGEPAVQQQFEVCVDGSCTTTSDGAYQVDAIEPGSRTVSLTPLAGWTQTEPAGGAGITVALSNGDHLTGQAFGMHSTTNVVGLVWNDRDGDGTPDAGEPGLGDVRVCLRYAGDEGSQCVWTGTSDTALGRYRVPGLRAGDIEVEVRTGYDVVFPAGGGYEHALTDGETFTADFGLSTGATRPAPPTGTRAVPHRRAVALTWTTPDDGGSPITDYTVERAPSATGPWSTAPDAVSSVSSSTIRGLAAGTRVFFRVAAVNAVGTGEWSQVVSATPYDVPGAPGHLTATAERRAVALTWTPSAPRGATVTDYVVQRTSAGGAWVTVRDSIRATPLATVRGLTPGTTTRFRVAAVNVAGRGAWSRVVKATPTK